MPERSERRIRATVHYDGQAFHGWQVQPDERTVQGAVEAALEQLFQRSVRLAAAGRTDRGVHAAGQEIAFPVPDGWEAGELRRSVNAVLPSDVWVEKLADAPQEFHPRFDATARRYVYLVGTRASSASPLRRGRIWQLCAEPDEPLLARQAASLVGERSFRAFAKSGQPERGHRCRVETARWSRTAAGDLHFVVVADRFLHHMVRYLVATLMQAATGRRAPEDLPTLLDGGEARPPRPAPPEGLYLPGVRYAGGWNRPGGVPGLAPPADAGDAAGLRPLDGGEGT